MSISFSSSSGVSGDDYTPPEKLDRAIQVLKYAHSLGIKGLTEYVKSRIESDAYYRGETDKESNEEFYGRISDTCWFGASYYSMWLGNECLFYNASDLGDEECGFPDKTVRIENFSLDTAENGVYYVSMEASESHYWIWVIKDQEIWYASSYGGTCSLILEKSERRSYANKFYRMLEGSMEDYTDIFYLDPANVSIEEVGNVQMSIRKLTNY